MGCQLDTQRLRGQSHNDASHRYSKDHYGNGVGYSTEQGSSQVQTQRHASGDGICQEDSAHCQEIETSLLHCSVSSPGKNRYQPSPGSSKQRVVSAICAGQREQRPNGCFFNTASDWPLLGRSSG